MKKISHKIIKLLNNNNFYVSDPLYDFIEKNNKYLKNFLPPDLALRKCKFHII